MSIRSRAGNLLMFAVNNLTATPPIQFQNFDNTSNFSISIWARPDPTAVNEPTLSYAGAGSMRLVLDTRKWYLAIYTNTGTRLSNTFLIDAQPPFAAEGWQVFCISKVGPNIKVYVGSNVFATTAPLPVNLVADFNVTLTFPFDLVALSPSHNLAICNFKYWNTALTQAQFFDQVNRWDAAGTPAPMWVSPLRIPGDISNVANPYTSTDFYAGHGYSVDFGLADTRGYPNNFEHFISDPQPLYFQTCPYWIYPLAVTPIVTYNPGTTPTVPTLYKSTQFFQFDDRGALPAAESAPVVTLTQIQYFAFPSSSGSGFKQSDSFPLMHNELGAEVPISTTNPANRFEQDTGVDITSFAPVPFRGKLYLWRYGGQFIWQPQPTAGPTATATLINPRLLISYVGPPSGVATLQPVDLTGLFVLRKDGITADTYNLGTELRIPDPTIRTAYIGE